MNLLDILGEFLRIFVDLIPRIHPRPASNQTAIIDAWWYGVQVCKRPVFYVPIMDVAETWDTPNEIVCNPDIQAVSTKDGKTLSVNAAIFFRIDDVIALRSHWGDEYLENIANITRAAIADWHRGRSAADCMSIDCDSVTDGLVGDFRKGGCKVHRVTIDERCHTKTLRLIGVKEGA